MRRLKSPLRVQELQACFKVVDGEDVALGYFYFADNPTALGNRLTRDEAREVAQVFAELMAELQRG